MFCLSFHHSIILLFYHFILFVSSFCHISILSLFQNSVYHWRWIYCFIFLCSIYSSSFYLLFFVLSSFLSLHRSLYCFIFYAIYCFIILSIFVSVYQMHSLIIMWITIIFQLSVRVFIHSAEYSPKSVPKSKRFTSSCMIKCQKSLQMLFGGCYVLLQDRISHM